MHFTSGINRPPFEASSGYLQVTSGCSHNRCAFCGYFKHVKHAVSPLDEIEEDIKQIPLWFGAPERIFLQGADAFSASYDVLMRVAELLHEHVPSVKTIGGYARIDNFCDKSEAQIRRLHEAGYENPYAGVESGDDGILKMVDKGYDAACAREQLEKTTAAGMPVIANFLNGIGGAGYGLSHARKTAELYAGMNISMIEVSSLTLVPGTPLAYRARKGTFVEAGEVERLREMQEFLRCLRNETVFLSDHISVPLHARTRLPEGKNQLIAAFDRLIDEAGEERLRAYRDAHPIM